MSAGPAEAILFDFDGVLVDSESAVDAAWSGWATEHGLDPGALRAVFHGRRTEEVVALMAPDLEPSREAAEIERAILTVDGGGAAIEGPQRLYSRVTSDRRGVVTSARRDTAEARLEHLAMEHPTALVTADDVAAGKPNPDCYLLGARLLGVGPSRCLVIEDAPAGVEAARAAGMSVIAVTTTHAAAELAAADRVVAPGEVVEAALAVVDPAVTNARQ